MAAPALLLRALLVLLVLIASLRAAGPFDGYHEEAIPTGQLFWKGWPVEDRQSVEAMIPKALAGVEDRLRRKLGRPFSTVLASDVFELRRVVERVAGSAPSDRAVLGVAVPSAMVLVIRGDSISSLEPLPVTVAHEVAHLVIHRSSSARIPRWLDEGVAMWCSQASIAPDEEAYLSFLARVDGLYRLESLEHQFPDAHALSSIAYEQSFLFIVYLAAAYGESSIPKLLDAFEGGASVDEALHQVSGLNQSGLEEQFKCWVSSRRSLASALTSIFNLWTLCAVLAIVAIARHWLWRRRRLAVMASDELGEPTSLEPEDLQDP